MGFDLLLSMFQCFNDVSRLAQFFNDLYFSETLRNRIMQQRTSGGSGRS